mmetsp:Transcript_28280/g.84382  ORF Transcript_28280/g.84382 Transcript_28280/m.84382 type:complete len:314 (+) Transcript_28280:116-1057(+)
MLLSRRGSSCVSQSLVLSMRLVLGLGIITRLQLGELRHVCGDATIDGNACARHEGRLRRAHIQYAPRNLVRLAQPAHWLVRAKPLEHARLVAGRYSRDMLIDRLRVRAPRAHGIATDPVLHIVCGDRARHREQRSFAHGVGEAVGHADERRDGADVDDAAAPAVSHHVLDRRLQAVERAGHVCRVHARYVVCSGDHQSTVGVHACIVDAAVEASGGASDSIEAAFHVSFNPNVAHMPANFMPWCCRVDLRCCSVESRPVEVDHVHTGTRRSKGYGGLIADAARGAGDDRRFAGEREERRGRRHCKSASSTWGP